MKTASPVAVVIWIVAVANASAGYVMDLTAAGSSDQSNGALYYQSDPQPAGTGVWDPFVRIQRTGNEAGYNTDGQIEFETKEFGGHNWTHSVLLADMLVLGLNGREYYGFKLDINEEGNTQGSKLSMNDFRLYLGNAGDLTGWVDGFGVDSVKVYDIDEDSSLGDVTVELLAKTNPPGSGVGDMFVYVPADLFRGHDAQFQYVYLYSRFGDPHGSGAGFEEWAFDPASGDTLITPEPSSWCLALLWGFIPSFRRRRNTCI